MSARPLSVATCLLVLLAACSDGSDGPSPSPDAGPDAGPDVAVLPDALPDAQPDSEDVPEDPGAPLEDATPDPGPDVQPDPGPADVPVLSDGQVDAVEDADAGPADATPDAPQDVVEAPLTHPLETAEQVRQIFDLHTLAASSTMTVAKRLFDAGTPDCPGQLTVTPETQTGAFGLGCTLTAEQGEVQLDGRLDFEIPNTCAGATSTLRHIEASAYALHGTWADTPVDLYFDLDYVREDPPSGLTWEWSGTARWASFPHTWFPNTWQILEGLTVHGESLRREGDSADGITWSGTMEIVGLGRVRIQTLKPMATTEPGCFVPSEGIVRLEGAVSATLVFDGKGECALPTWTRDGVPMGEVDYLGWGFLTICFSGS